MATQVQRRKGTTVQHSTFTGASAELTVDTTKNTVVVHDGATAGGIPLAKESGSALSPSSLSLPNGTANAVPYLNGSKVLTSGSALTFDGGNLNIGATGYPYRLTAVRSNDGVVGYFRRDSGTINPALMISAKETGNTVGFDTDYAGATSPTITFSMGGTEQMRLTSTGLGIGTSSPGAKLQVAGSGRFTGFDTGYYNENVLAIGNASFNPKLGMASNSGFRWNTRIRDVGGNGEYVVRYEEGSLDALVIDRSGNLGLGVTPSAWNTAGGAALQIKNASLISYGNADVELAFNSFYDGTSYKYIANGFSTRYDQVSGSHIWYRASSGTAGAAISFTQAMTLTAAGDLCVGGTSSLSTATGRTDLTVNGASSGGIISFGTAGVRRAYLYQDNTDFTIANETAGVIRFLNNGSERARIDSSGNLIQSAPTTAPTLATNGTMVFNLTSNTNLRVSVRGSDGVTRTANLTLA